MDAVRSFNDAQQPASGWSHPKRLDFDNPAVTEIREASSELQALVGTGQEQLVTLTISVQKDAAGIVKRRIGELGYVMEEG
jgi:hypothetical protein